MGQAVLIVAFVAFVAWAIIQKRHTDTRLTALEFFISTIGPHDEPDNENFAAEVGEMLDELERTAPTSALRRSGRTRPRLCVECAAEPPLPARHWSGRWLGKRCVAAAEKG